MTGRTRYGSGPHTVHSPHAAHLPSLHCGLCAPRVRAQVLMQISGSKRLQIIDPARLHTAYPCVAYLQQLRRVSPGVFEKVLAAAISRYEFLPHFMDCRRFLQVSNDFDSFRASWAKKENNRGFGAQNLIRQPGS